MAYVEVMIVNPPELEDAIAKHRLGRVDEAEPVYRSFTRTHPELDEPWHLLGVIALQRNAPQSAEPFFREAIKRNPSHVKCLSNLGGALYQLERYAESEQALKAALSLSPDYVSARYNLGNTLLAMGRLQDARLAFEQAIAIQPDHVEAQNNLAETQKLMGTFDAAVETLQVALAQTPGNKLLENALIDILNYHMPKAERQSAYVEAQAVLQSLSLEGSDRPAPSTPLSDEAIGRLYRRCRDVLTTFGIGGDAVSPQIWRGATDDPDCRRHMKVFKTFNAIPEFCFHCYKIQIEPQTVVELFKLLMIFDAIALPGNNTRKCLVEVRPEISGAYKGLIYCQSREEGLEILNIVKTAIHEQISPQIPVVLKRGCSEFPVAYPEYGHFDETGKPTMVYNEQWRELEDYVDQNLSGYKRPNVFPTHNHPGFTVRDTVVMGIWLAYAAAIGDMNYLKISGTPVDKLPLSGRAPFKGTV